MISWRHVYTVRDRERQGLPVGRVASILKGYVTA